MGISWFHPFVADFNQVVALLLSTRLDGRDAGSTARTRFTILVILKTPLVPPANVVRQKRNTPIASVGVLLIL